MMGSVSNTGLKWSIFNNINFNFPLFSIIFNLFYVINLGNLFPFYKIF